MSRFHSHINTAKAILNLYKGDIPFSAFLKSFFAKEKKYGSRDRRTISSLCYNYFRLGSSLKELSLDEQIVTAVFLSSDVSNDWLENAKPEWNDKVTLPLFEKLPLTKVKIDAIFPFNDQLSSDVDVAAFNLSFLIQPDLFIRIRPGKRDVVKRKLAATQIPFQEISESCLAFANGTKLEDVLVINNEAVIQDLSSQRVAEFIPSELKAPKVWDCCAASGGKSIMAYDCISAIQLTVSDVRQSIIQNLQTRFREAGIKDYRSFVADLTKHKNLQASLGNAQFDLIICDAPCSGSGTWSRTPEQLLFFKEQEIKRYSDLQKSIAKSALHFVKKSGYFLYITCSVFTKENEEVVEFIQRESGFELIKMELLKGYDRKADTMFAALFKLN